MTTTLIQIPDDQNTDTGVVRLVAPGEAGLIERFTYLVCESAGREFFLQIATANRNLSRFSPEPFKTVSLAAHLALLEETGYTRDSIVSTVTYYDATVESLLGADGRPATPFVRPVSGAVASLASTEQINRYLQLPAPEDRHRIGQLARSGEKEVPISVDEKILDHHLLVAGSTGSGKSHLLSNVAHAAVALGRAVVLFDHKPDHQDHHSAHSKWPRQEPFSLNGVDRPDWSVRYWTLDPNDPNSNAKRLGVLAQDLDPDLLAGAIFDIFDRPNEDKQAETFGHFLGQYAAQNSGKSWTIHEAVAFFSKKRKGEIEKLLYGDNGGTLHSGTYEAMRRRLSRPNRIPSFVDVRSQRDAFGSESPTPPPATVEELFQAPGLNVVRVGEGDSRGYALFLSRVLARAAQVRRAAVQDAGVVIPSIEIVIDEASDIFKADSRHLRDAATGMLAEQIRKGRSLRIRYTVPSRVRGTFPRTSVTTSIPRSWVVTGT
ncbi:MAG: DUF87 domain-containing protein [Acidobacteria bacterium]|nr:DUF87 domain-containing protein [Acidobacteriota bacterium]